MPACPDHSFVFVLREVLGVGVFFSWVFVGLVGFFWFVVFFVLRSQLYLWCPKFQSSPLHSVPMCAEPNSLGGLCRNPDHTQAKILLGTTLTVLWQSLGPDA